MSAIELYGYQADSVQALREGFAAGHNRQMLYLPTGGGKTELALYMMDGARIKNNRTSFIADRRNLVEQTSARLDKYGIPHGVQMAGSERMKLYEPIQVCSAQTLEKRGAANDMALLVIDEAHQIRKETVKFLDANPSVRAIGLSATPLPKGLGKVFSRVVCATTQNHLVAEGRLIMPTVYCAKEIDMTGAKKVAGEWSADDVGQRSMCIIGDIVSTYLEKTKLHFGGPVKTIVHGSSVEACAELAQRFVAAGVNFIAISYKDDEDFKQDVYREFAKPNSSIMGIIAVDMLTKGFDCPSVLCSIMARPFSKSTSSVIQQLGRVMRSAPGKSHAIQLDHAGNWLRHGEQMLAIFEAGIHELDDGAEKSRPEKTDKEKEECKCPKCSALWLGASDTCAACGYVRQSRNSIKTVKGEVSEFEVRKIEIKARQQFLSELLRHEIARGYKQGWAAASFREKYGNYPTGYKMEPADSVGAATAGWIKSRRIAWANRQTA